MVPSDNKPNNRLRCKPLQRYFKLHKLRVISYIPCKRGNKGQSRSCSCVSFRVNTTIRSSFRISLIIAMGSPGLDILGYDCDRLEITNRVPFRRHFKKKHRDRLMVYCRTCPSQLTVVVQKFFTIAELNIVVPVVRYSTPAATSSSMVLLARMDSHPLSAKGIGGSSYGGSSYNQCDVWIGSIYSTPECVIFSKTSWFEFSFLI